MKKAGRPSGRKSHRNKGGLQAPDLTSRKARGGEGDGDLGEMGGLGRTGGRGTGLALFLFLLFAGLVCCGLAEGSQLGAGEGLLVDRDWGSTEPKLSQNRQRGSLGGMQSGPHPGISGQSAGRRQWD